MAHGRDTDRPLDDCRVALTGRFASLTQEEFSAVVQDLGGRVDGSPTRHTRYLVVGEGQLPLDEEARPPRALEKARRLQVLGYPVEILPEHEFWNRFDVFGSTESVRRLYTIGQLAKILGVKRDVIRHWLKVGLICPVEIVHRLAFFDFAQVQSAKTLCDLAKRGISTVRIRSSLEQLRRWLPNAGTALSQLALIENGGRLLMRYGGFGMMESTGQLQIDFTPDTATTSVPWSEHLTADELFEEALELHDSGRYADAAKVYLKAIELDSTDAVLYFNLANALYEEGHFEDSAANYVAATQRDPQYAEAWNALGCVLSCLNRSDEAILTFRRAIELVPGYGDAHFNLASELEEQGETVLASEHWRRYIKLDRTGPWAEIAQKRLEAHDNRPARILSSWQSAAP